jgi:methionyl-tRNA formyltransferase
MTVFFGTSSYSALFLDQAIKNGLRVNLVVTAPSKPIGRKQILTENPTVSAVKKHNIPFIDNLNQLTHYPPNQLTLGLILDYHRLIPQSIIDLFSKGIINIHFSRLPQYRGPAPVQYTILNGEQKAWLTYFLITEKLDEGPVLTQTSFKLDGNETTQGLYQKLTLKAAAEIKAILKDYLAGKITPQTQQGKPSYTQKLSSEKAKIDWRKNPGEIERLIRAAFPEPTAWTEVKIPADSQFQTKRLKILKAHLENTRLALDQVQLEGKNPVSWKQFKEGYLEAKI